MDQKITFNQVFIFWTPVDATETRLIKIQKDTCAHDADSSQPMFWQHVRVRVLVLRSSNISQGLLMVPSC